MWFFKDKNKCKWGIKKKRISARRQFKYQYVSVEHIHRIEHAYNQSEDTEAGKPWLTREM